MSFYAVRFYSLLDRQNPCIALRYSYRILPLKGVVAFHISNSDVCSIAFVFGHDDKFMNALIVQGVS